MTTIPTNPAQPVNGDPWAGATVGCSSCTVPTDRPDGLCAFCADPPPPLNLGTADTRLVGAAANYCSIAIEDLQDAMGTLPAGTSMWVTVDLVRAQRYLRAALRVIESAGAQLDAKGDQ